MIKNQPHKTWIIILINIFVSPPGLNLVDVLQTHSDSEHDEVASQSTQLLELIDEMQEQSSTSDSHSQVFNGILKQVSLGIMLFQV